MRNLSLYSGIIVLFLPLLGYGYFAMMQTPEHHSERDGV